MISSKEQIELEKLVKDVGDCLKTYWPGDPNSKYGKTLNIYEKPDHTKVTQADLAANEILVAGLRRLFPNDAIVSEEGPKDNGHQNMSRVWIVDPLDGTSSFISGRDDFSVLVGLCIDTQIVWGCMYFPIKEIFVTAAKGQGSKLGRVSESQNIRPLSIYYRNCELKATDLLYKEWMDSGMALTA
jgi:3'-phosphoadenosine 5'-phosphosulfate (PAPS) 3'-phosphatase